MQKMIFFTTVSEFYFWSRKFIELRFMCECTYTPQIPGDNTAKKAK